MRNAVERWNMNGQNNLLIHSGTTTTDNFKLSSEISFQEEIIRALTINQSIFICRTYTYFKISNHNISPGITVRL